MCLFSAGKPYFAALLPREVVKSEADVRAGTAGTQTRTFLSVLAESSVVFLH